ncbi:MULTISPECIES: acyl-CoA dehydrogenase family protein [Rhodococcus]|uniref:Acyl-[acyl-carrier-protein] dehydrogenase MbtN n=1 Tax=Rhodococcus aetherivorans TaxID=191292 RepID=A0AA46NXW2_9NOCA|nr:MULTISPECIES: acyl-CoA dehydrogenase family protein [Rhodococcus]AKE88215.1 acyl-CoA dehydrogenase [Rhodococcus aetherivorans]ANZ27158.1 acyl-CoA dehydrogenase [Rhodococcus sp. WB1]MBC2592253.1 acyl-CoA dehydrogenase family protein [Rhodococcus aetherivorans]QIX48487.1 acyl-CoA dehydrogenase [Rhodococcus sp. DMU1]UGQ40953.1 acyl-CoA dehydrogenase family protein [Rhodococcus aetherivorans]
MQRKIYDADHEAFRVMIRDFIAAELSPYYMEWEHDHIVPRDFFRKLGAIGVTGFGIPEVYGGPGEVSFKYQAIISEENARASVHMGHYGLSTGMVLPYLLTLATDEQKQRWLPGIASGDILLCIAMTEPGTGSDLAGIRTSARLSDDGRHYVLNGAKTFISGARNSELCVVVARTAAPSETDRRNGLSLLVVPTDSEGFEFGRNLDKIGLKSSDTNELSFADVHVPVENLLGEEGMAFSYLGQNLPRERLIVGVDAVSRARAAVEMTRAYVQERKVFGKPVAAFQNTKFVLAECDVEVETSQALVDRGIELEDAHELTPADAARIKLQTTEMAGRVVDKCLQLHGGYGYMREYAIARMFTDLRVNRIYGGSTEVMKTIIAKDMGL